jgi:hypothetical protein
MTDKKVEINLLAVGLFLLLIFSLGFMTKRELVSRKEIRKLKNQISGIERVVDKMGDTISLKSDTIHTLKQIVKSNTVHVKSLQKEIKILDSRIANYELTIPPNEVYAELQEMRPDTLKKEWPFSTPQINGIYQDEEELALRKQEVFKYESITGMLIYNVQLLGKTDSLKSNQLKTSLAITEEYKKISAIKDRQIEAWMKKGRGRMTWGLTSTGIAVGLFLLLLF